MFVKLFFCLLSVLAIVSCKKKKSKDFLLTVENKSLKESYSKILKIKKKGNFPNLVYIVIDTLRRDFSEKEAPFLSSFMKENFTPEMTVATATSTAHSNFSIYWGLLPHIRYSLINNRELRSDPSEYLRGSPNLFLLKNLGYSIKSFAYQDLMFCLNKYGKPYELFQTEQVIHMQLNYSLSPQNFFIKCNRYKRTMLLSENWGLLDNKVADDFIKNLEVQSKKVPYLSIIRLQAVHHPYGWMTKRRMDSEYLKKYPFKWKEPANLHYLAGKKEKFEYASVINSYRNAVHSADYQIWKMIKALKERGLYDSSTIIITSDHGHALFDVPTKKGFNGHGFTAFEVLYNIPMTIKFSEARGKKKSVELASTLDIWPTVLGSLGVSLDSLKNNLPFMGKDLFKEKRNCSVSFKPEYDFERKSELAKPLSFFSLITKNETLIFEMDNKRDAFSPEKINFLYRTDRKGKIQKFKSGFSSKDLQNHLKKNYSSCLSELSKDSGFVELFVM